VRRRRRNRITKEWWKIEGKEIQRKARMLEERVNKESIYEKLLASF
jgi:hypothetical protein